MKLVVTVGSGHGTTELSAFDGALVDAGVANYNLIPLSSVIPPNSEIVSRNSSIDVIAHGEWGDRLYVVLSEMRTSIVQETAWAGIGWVQDSSGKGLLVEHHASSEVALRNAIKNSLMEMMLRRQYPIELPIRMTITSAQCIDKPVCALVAVVFLATAWQSQLVSSERRVYE